MSRGWWTKLVLVLVFIVTSIVYVYPTVANIDLEKTKFPFKQKINLGLDLQGGLYLVLGVDFNKVFADVVDRQSINLGQRLKEKSISFTSSAAIKSATPQDDPRMEVKFEPSQRTAIYDLFKKEYTNLRLAGEGPGRLEFGLSNEYRAEVRDRTLNQSIEVIRNRIDEFGVAEPAISSQGTDRVVVELPGVKEVDRAKDLIGRTAKLEFHIADDKTMPPQQVAALIAQIEKDNSLTYKEGQKFSDYVQKINEFAKGKIPADDMISFERTKVLGQVEQIRTPYLLHSRADVTGEELADASVQLDPETRRPNVAFQMNPRGATLFGDLTGANVGKRLAIVLDNIVQSAPVINSKITERGQITLGRGDGDAQMKEAKDLAIVLRAGALPAQLEFLEQRVVGPSLGADSIAKGAKAGFVGCMLVFIFMIFYYRASGVVAVISLLLNFLFSFAILIGMDATLTLPGIAGLALIVGMAVDSNVIIFERIRDELMEGKSVAGAVEAGFQKAFNAIFDANITHGIVAVILLSYGSGPVRGFAVTLLIGIFTTLFCAVTVCKLFFDGYLGLSKKQITKLSI